MRTQPTLSLRALAALGLALLVAACGPPPSLRDQVRTRKSSLSALKRKVRAAEARGGGNGGRQGYVDGVSGRGGERAYHILLPPAELQRAAKALLPYTFDARSLHKDISGTVTVTSASSFRMGNNDRFTFRCVMKGRNLQYHGKQSGYRSHIKKIRAGMAKGLDVDVRGHVSVQGGRLQLKVLATRVQLRKHANSNYHKMLKGAINKYLWKQRFAIDTGGLRVGGRSVRPFRAMATRNQLVLSFE